MVKQLKRLGTLCLMLLLSAVSQAADFKDFSVIVNNQEGTLLTSEEQKQGTEVSFGVAVADDGTVSRVAADDASAVATISGKYHSEHGCTALKVVVPVSGSVDITVGQCTYSKKAIVVTDAEGKEVATVTPEAPACWKNDPKNVNVIRYDGEATTLTITGMDYCPFVAVNKVPEKQLATLDKEPATATFAFNLGTEEQKAEFSNAYFITSKVTYGDNLTLFGKNTVAGVDQTQFMPLTQQNESEGGTAADESNAIRFLIQPNYGLTFTPTKVSLKTSRFGTDNGLLDIAWENPDKTTVLLEQGVKPARNNGSPNISELSYTIEGAKPAEGTCGLLVNLYHLQNGKQIGFADIVIEGTLSGTEKEVPVLATVTINGQEFTAAALFDDAYEVEYELSKKVAMISDKNPVTATAKKGEVGTITYEGDETKCKVTIPMTYGETPVEYVLNIVQKPDFKLTYIDTDKSTVLGEFIREKDEKIGAFDIDYATATAQEGTKVRGWFLKTAGGEKYTAETVVTGDISLYAVATEIETASKSDKYNFDLTDKLFDAADHEAFTPTGEGFYWHDAQHGWAFKTGNKIDLLVGPKATVSVTLCRYGAAEDITITDASGKEIGKIAGKNNDNVDGEIVAFNYEGEGGVITLNLNTSGEMYIHGVKIVNTAEAKFEQQGSWYFVKPGDAKSLIEVLEIVNGANASKDAERSFIYVPDGIYDLNETVKTAISGHNISIIGQSMDKTIIKTAPDKSIEGLGSADMFSASGTNLYMQDITLQNALDYYGALGGGQVGGRAAVIQDRGDRTIFKNVRMLSYQDTYYSSNDAMQSYFENCDVHGTVDFICGGGDVRFQNCTISLEPRNTNGTGGRTVVAPRGTVKFGYVFDGCKVVDLAEGKGDWNLGRTWNNDPITVYLNTTLDENAQKTLVASRWTQKGMNSKDPVVFGEFNTMDAAGNNITPESNVIKSYGGDFQTIFTAEQADDYSYQKMFSANAEKTWNPAALTMQSVAPANLKLDGNTLTWTPANDGTECWAVFQDGQLLGITDSPSYDVENAAGMFEVRGANKMGGLGEAAVTTTVAISNAGYATFYDSENNYQLPSGLKAYVVTDGNISELTYKELDVIPAGTAVMLEAVNKAAGSYELIPIDVAVNYAGPNLLKGSDVATTTTGDIANNLYYKLAYGHSGTAQANAFGWYWGAEDGAAFEIEAHRAWLAIPVLLASTRGYIVGNGTTAITTKVAESQEEAEYYNLQGQRVAAPTKGLYIKNNKKVIIK